MRRGFGKMLVAFSKDSYTDNGLSWKYSSEVTWCSYTQQIDTQQNIVPYNILVFFAINV